MYWSSMINSQPISNEIHEYDAIPINFMKHHGIPDYTLGPHIFRDVTPLHIAAIDGHIAVAEALFDGGAKMEACDGRGQCRPKAGPIGYRRKGTTFVAFKKLVY